MHHGRTKNGTRTRRGLVAKLATTSVVAAAFAGATAMPPAAAATATVGNGLTTTDLQAVGMSPTSLATALVGTGVTVSNVTYSGANSQAGLVHVVDPAVVSFNDGVILSSGNVADVVGPNKSDGITGDMAGPADADLNALIANSQTVYPMTFDAASLEFDFVPAADHVYFTYTFASDEYLEWVNLFNDVFAFYVNGQNCATVPNGAPVSIDTINSAVNPNLFRDNSYSSPPANPINFESDGLSVEMICSAPVIAGQTNHMKMAIADTSDQILDSVVLIKAQSLSTIKPESCNDGVDNDDDLLVDNADDSCLATTTPPPPGQGGIGSSGSAPPFTGNEGTPILLDAGALGWSASPETLTTSWTVSGINGTTGTCDVTPAGPVPLASDGTIALATTVCPNEGEYVARVEGRDAEGKSSFDFDVDFFVHNAPPAVAIDTPVQGEQAVVGSEVALSATVTDPGLNDAVTCEISWGDDTTDPGTLVGDTCTGSHTYTVAGTPILSVTASDDAGDSSAAATIVAVAEARSISGAVTAAGSPAAGILVAAFADTDGFVPTATATTEANGSYLLPDLPVGTYRIAFVPVADPSLAITWFGAPGRWEATPLAVTATTALGGIDADLAAIASVRGTVTDLGGQPVPGVIVAGYTATDGFFPSIWATTGTDGTYLLNSIPTETYRLAFVPSSASAMRLQWHGGTDRATATPFSVVPGTSLTGIDIQLPPLPQIMGTITRADGTPVVGAVVLAYDADDGWIGTVQTTTGADGTYRLMPFPPNTYRILVSPPAGSGLAVRWFGNTRIRQNATPITVGDATIVTGVDVTLIG